jgi:hypothetical protein
MKQLLGVIQPNVLCLHICKQQFPSINNIRICHYGFVAQLRSITFLLNGSLLY